MTDDEKKLLIGDELTTSTTEIAELCFPGQERPPKVFSDFLAHLLGRATVLASSAVLGVVKPLNARLDQTDIRLRTLAERISGLEGRQDTNTRNIGDMHRRLNGRADQIDALLDRLNPGGEVDQLTQLLYSLARDVEQLKERAAGDEPR